MTDVLPTAAPAPSAAVPSATEPIAAVPPRRDPSATALVLALVAPLWFGWGSAELPASWSVLPTVGSWVGLLLAVPAAVLTWRRRHGRSAMADPAGRRDYLRTVAVEVVAIFLGSALLNRVGAPQYLAGWTLFVVGVHFVPLGRLFGVRILQWAGAVLAAWAGVAVLAGLIGTAAPQAAAGLGGGVLLLGFATGTLCRAVGTGTGNPDRDGAR